MIQKIAPYSKKKYQFETLKASTYSATFPHVVEQI